MTPPFFTWSFSKSQGCRRSRSARHIPDRSRSRISATLSPTAGVGARERSIIPKGTPRRCGCFLSYQLSHTGNLESSLLDGLTEDLEVLSAHLFQGRLYNAGTADTYIDDGICLRHAVESACHEGVVIRSVAEYHQFGAAQRILFLRQLRGLSYDLSHEADSIHVDAASWWNLHSQSCRLRSVVARASGMERIRFSSLFVIPLDTRAE